MLKKIFRIENIALLIILTIFIDISPISIAGSYVRIYQFLCLIFFAIYFIVDIKESRKINVNLSTPLIKNNILWIVSYFFSFKNIVSIKDFMVIFIGQVFLLIMYYVFYNYYSNKEEKSIERSYNYFIYGGIFIVVIGIAQWILGSMGLNIGLTHKDVLGIARPTSLMRETDWYGMTCMFIGIMLFVHYITENYFLNKKFNFTIVILSVIGLLLSMTRAAMLGFAVGGFVLLLTRRYRIRTIKYTGVFIVIICSVFLVFTLLNPQIAKKYTNRLNPVTTAKTDNGSSDSRVYALNLTIDYIKKHPIVGNGVGGLNKLSLDENIKKKYANGGDLNSGRGNANIFLSNMFDTGIIGTIIFFVLMIRYLVTLLQAYKCKQDIISLGLFVGFIALLTDFMFNNGIRFGFIWLAMALANVRISKVKEI